MLMGPFVEDENDLIKKGDLAKTYGEIFLEQMRKVVEYVKFVTSRSTKVSIRSVQPGIFRV